ncbi:unnamed protein product, partial [Coregonus sp. 'balchen']
KPFRSHPKNGFHIVSPRGGSLLCCLSSRCSHSSWKRLSAGKLEISGNVLESPSVFWKRLSAGILESKGFLGMSTSQKEILKSSSPSPGLEEPVRGLLTVTARKTESF